MAAAGALGLAAELGARAWIRARREYFVWRPWERTHLHPDLQALPGLEPLVRFWANADGERGGELPADRAGLYRVLIAGGSAAEGYLLDQGSSWSGLLERSLNAPDALRTLGARRVHVGNIARSLVPCEAIFEMLVRVLPRYERLDLAILMVGGSDVVHWLEQRCPETLADERFDPDYVFAEHCERKFGWTPNSLAVRALASRCVRRLGRVKQRHGVGTKLIELRARRRNALEWIDATPSPEPMLARFETYLARMIDSLRATGARVIVVRQPWFEKRFTAEEEAVMWNFCVGRPYLEPTTSYYTHRVVGELMHAVDARAEAVARRLSVEQLDLMAVLERSLSVYYDYLHFTPRGARDVAASVAACVLAGARGPVD